MLMARDTLAELGDEALLALYANGEAMAARLLMARLLPPTLRFAARVLGDRAEAEDVAQEAMLRLLRIAGDWREGQAQPRTWLYRVVANLCTDRLRARSRRAATSIDDVAEPEDPGQGTLAALIEKDRLDALSGALNCLPDRQRQAVILRHIEGLANPEIAEILEIGVEAVESLTARGKRALQAILAGRKADLGFEDED
jgi:RNA polymerase sigma factor (sigma-70 family)